MDPRKKTHYSHVYSKLYPPAPTPQDELCKCIGAPPIKLVGGLSYNPVCCMNCNLEVPPEKLHITEHLAESIAHWRQVYDALHVLWLDSRDYEDWAKSQLLDLSGQVNLLGRQCQTDLNAARKCYYLLFQDVGNVKDPGVERILSCPVCQQILRDYNHGKFAEQQLTCENCLLVAFSY